MDVLQVPMIILPYAVQVSTGEIMEFLQEHMVTKEEAKEFATKHELQEL